MIDRLRACAAAVVDTWNEESAHYLLHVERARNTALHNACHRLRSDLIDAEDRAATAEGEQERLEELVAKLTADCKFYATLCGERVS